MWTIGTCPTTVLLSTTSKCVYEWQHWRRLVLGILHKVWCGPVCSPGSWSGRGWLPLILVWHRTVVGLSCSYCEAHLKRTTNPSCGALYKSLTYYLLLLYSNSSIQTSVPFHLVFRVTRSIKKDIVCLIDFATFIMFVRWNFLRTIIINSHVINVFKLKRFHHDAHAHFVV